MNKIHEIFSKLGAVNVKTTNGTFHDADPIAVKHVQDELYTLIKNEVIGEEPEGDSTAVDGRCEHACHVIAERLTKHEQLARLDALFGKEAQV